MKPRFPLRRRRAAFARGQAALLCAFALAQVSAAAAELSLDGRTYLPDLMIGDPVRVRVSGPPGASALLVADAYPGPLFALGGSGGKNGVAPMIGPQTVLLPLPALPAAGLLELAVFVPADAGLAGRDLGLRVVLKEASPPHAASLTNPARIKLREREVELAGRSLATYPFFEHVRAFNEGEAVELGVDAARAPALVGPPAPAVDIYVVAAKSRAEWLADPTLADVSGAPLPFQFARAGIQQNTVTLNPGTLSGARPDGGLGVGFDVVIDVDRDGLLGGRDLIDGRGDEAGFYVVADIAAPGPFQVVETLYNVGGSFGGQNTYYPANAAQLGRMPLVVVSHGNGHDFQWYDHIGYHLASYGCVVMSHENNTVPGSHTAATTTLSNTEAILAQQGAIDGGVLLDHIDSTRIVWIGHSRGGDGVARAYDRIADGTYVPQNFTKESIKLISSIAPVDFGGAAESNPHDANFHLWVGQSDTDVTGCANADAAQSFHLHDRAVGTRLSISLHGVGHGDFHAQNNNPFATGPCLVGRDENHKIMRGHLLALVKHFVEGNLPAKDYLWRQYEAFHPIGAPAQNPCVVANLMYREGAALGTFVIDDFQSEPAADRSSSGGEVKSSIPLVEDRLDDRNNSFNYNAADSMNGFTVAGNGDDSRGLVLEYSGGPDHWLEFEIVESAADFTPYRYLSFRVAQATRHPYTTAELGDLTFGVKLVDDHGAGSSINIGAFGGGVEEPYQREKCGGVGAGWNSDFETIRLPLDAFRNDFSGLDLAAIRKVVFLFGPGHGSRVGRLGFDDLQLTRD